VEHLKSYSFIKTYGFLFHPMNQSAQSNSPPHISNRKMASAGRGRGSLSGRGREVASSSITQMSSSRTSAFSPQSISSSVLSPSMTNLQLMSSRTEPVRESSSSSSPFFSILERMPVEGGHEVSLGEFFGHAIHDEGTQEGSAEIEAPELDATMPNWDSLDANELYKLFALKEKYGASIYFVTYLIVFVGLPSINRPGCERMLQVFHSGALWLIKF